MSIKVEEKLLPILFLDFDGVLHPDPCYEESLLFKQSRWLVKDLDLMNVDIVISSDWRLAYLEQESKPRTVVGLKPPKELLTLLPEELARKVIAVTPYWKNLHGSVSGRQRECEIWIRDNRPGSFWLAIEDRRYFFDRDFNQLYLCNPRTGLTEHDVQPLRDKICELVEMQNQFNNRRNHT